MYRFIAFTLIVLEIVAASPAGKSSCNCGKKINKNQEKNPTKVNSIENTPPVNTKKNSINHQIKTTRSAERKRAND